MSGPIPLQQVRDGEIVIIKYTNHRGVTGDRRIVPQAIHFGTSQWHHRPQWLMTAWDMDKSAARTFAMVDVQSWEEA